MSVQNVPEEDLTAADEGSAVDRLRSAVGEHRWLVGFLLVEVGLLGAGFAIDTLAGATPDQGATLHVVAGLLAAFAVIVGAAGILGGSAWAAYRLFREFRSPEAADPA